MLDALPDVFAQLGYGPSVWLAMELAMVAAYTVFGIAGFGTALVAGPILVHFMPLSRVIPMLVMLDFLAAFGNMLQGRQFVVRGELGRLVPCMAVGCSIGVAFLLNLRSDLLLLMMGLFLVAYALYSLLVKVRPAGLSPWWAIPMGTAGGLFGALFGSGGFLYAIYLNARMADKQKARATQNALISCSTLVRVTLFIIAGVYTDIALLLIAVCLLPGMLAGSWIGRHLTLRMSREAFVRVITWLVLVSGITLIARYMGIG